LGFDFERIENEIANITKLIKIAKITKFHCVVKTAKTSKIATFCKNKLRLRHLKINFSIIFSKIIFYLQIILVHVRVKIVGAEHAHDLHKLVEIVVPLLFYTN